MDIATIRSLCPTTDDLWLRVVGIKGGYNVVKLDAYSKDWFKISGSQKERLTLINHGKNANDEAMKKLVEYFGLSIDAIGGIRK